MTYHKEEGRRARGAGWLEALAADSRFALRHFRRNPGATLTMLIVLAIGMSISTALFSFIHAYSNQSPLGVTASDDLVRIRGRDVTEDGVRLRRFTADELEEYRRLTSHFAEVAGFATHGVTLYLERDGRAESGAATFVTPNYFDLVGVRPVIGAGLPRAESAGAAPQLVAVVGYGVWERLFSRSPGIIGATLTVHGVDVTIVGVAPRQFSGLDRYNAMTVWMPAASRPLVIPGVTPEAEAFRAAARLAPGMDRQRATAAVQVIGQRIVAAREQVQPTRRERRAGTDVVPLLATNDNPEFDSEVLYMAIAASMLGVLILLITCTNVSALQTGLALMRRREIAIRLSMGASRRRIVRQLLTETVILATLAAGTGLGIVWLIQRFLITRLPDVAVELAVSGPAMAFAFGLALAVGMLFGLSPALHATRLTVSSALKDSTGAIAAPRVRLQRGLVVAQIALTQPLIVVLGVMMGSVYAEYRSRGLDTSAEQVVSMRMRPAAGLAADSAREWTGEIRALRDRLSSTPSITGAVQNLDYTIMLDNYSAHPEDRISAGRQQPFPLSAPMIAPGYLGVMGMRLILGRDFTESDRTPPIDPKYAAVAIPVIIGSDLAEDLWPSANPLGRRLRYAPTDGGGPPLTVIGVLEPQPGDDFKSSVSGYKVFFPPDSIRAASSLAMMIRTSGDAGPLIPTIRRVVQETTPRLAITDTRTIADLDRAMLEVFKLAGKSLGGAGLLTLFLAAIGLYAVVSFAVSQRTSEIAVRMAIGARSGQIVGKFVGEGVRLGVIGLALGLPLSLLGLRMLAAQPQAPPVPIAVIAVAAGVGVMAVALMATWIPARRAAGVDPATVLRRD